MYQIKGLSVHSLTPPSFPDFEFGVKSDDHFYQRLPQ